MEQYRFRLRFAFFSSCIQPRSWGQMKVVFLECICIYSGLNDEERQQKETGVVYKRGITSPCQIALARGEISNILGSFSCVLYTVYLKLFRYQGRSSLMIVSSSYGLRTCLVLRRLSWKKNWAQGKAGRRKRARALPLLFHLPMDHCASSPVTPVIRSPLCEIRSAWGEGRTENYTLDYALLKAEIPK